MKKDISEIVYRLDNTVVTNLFDAKDVFENRPEIKVLICLDSEGRYAICKNIEECEKFYPAIPKSIKPIDEVVEPHVSDIRYYYGKFEEGDCDPDELELQELNKIEGMLKDVADKVKSIYDNHEK